jgi:hypothetical protein
MPSDLSYVCRSCGERHDEAPLSYGIDVPAYWLDSFADDPSSSLQGELCVIQAEHFFIRGRILIPVVDADPETTFDWGVWASLSPANFERTVATWTVEGRESEPSAFGWLATELPLYRPTTLNLKTRVHTQPVGQRPLIELEPTDHPLAVEQRQGITMARVQEIAEFMLHPA